MTDSPAWRRPALWGLVALSLAAHAPFLLRGLGEPDAARLCIDAILWHRTGRLNAALADYRPRTSPLYLHALKKALDWGLPIESLSVVMNWSNVIVGSLALIPMYLLLKRLTDARAALAACVLYSFVPAFWLASLYGMPHLPAFALFLAALALFGASRKAAGRRRAALTALATLCMAVACLLKADVVVCAGAFVGVLLCQRALSVRNVASAVAMVALGVLVTLLYTRLILPGVNPLGRFDATRAERFPISPETLVSEDNLRVVSRSVGPVLACACLAAGLYCAVAGRAQRRLLALALLWSLPPLLLWGLKFGNSARHMMAPALPLVLLVAASAFSIRKLGRGAYALLALLVMGNYASTRVNTSTVTPSSRVFEAPGAIQDYLETFVERSRDFERLAADKKLLVARGASPYALYEVAARAQEVEVAEGSTEWEGEMVVRMLDGRRERVAWIYVEVKQAGSRYAMEPAEMAKVEARRREGWALWPMEKVVRLALRQSDESVIRNP